MAPSGGPRPGRRILFISHEASLTGGPILLLTLLKWLKANASLSFDILLLRDGPLRLQFAALGHTVTVDEVSGRGTMRHRLMNRLAPKAAEHWQRRVVERLKRRRYDLVYGNSIVSLPWTVLFQECGPMKAIGHVHEMAWMIERLLPKEEVVLDLPKLDLIVACSQATARDLVDGFGVARTSIDIAYSFIDDVRLVNDAASVRAELGIAPGQWVIGGAGTPEMRKGFDLLAPIASRLRKKKPELDFRMLWVGGTAHQHEMVSFCRVDAQRLGVADRITWLPQTERPNDYLNVMDVVLVPSREEPLSLVALAAASLRKPVVAFEQGGGIVEVLSDGCGCTVPYLDLDAMVEAIVELIEDPERARALGARARQKVHDQFRAEVVAPALGALIENTLDSRLPRDRPL